METYLKVTTESVFQRNVTFASFREQKKKDTEKTYDFTEEKSRKC